MTSPTQPPRESFVTRITTRFSGGGSASDPEERFTRNVTYGFIALIAIVALVVIFGLIYGVWDSTFRPIGNVGGTEISRSMLEDRLELERFRAERAEGQLRTQLAAGAIDAGIFESRLSAVAADRDAIGEPTLDRLVDLLLQRQLAADAGITLSESELEAAVAASGASPELRRIRAMIMVPEETLVGLPTTRESRQDALMRAEAAHAAIEDGGDFIEVLEQYANEPFRENGGELGVQSADDIDIAAWREALWSIEAGETTGIVEGDSGEYLIGYVEEIIAPQPDPGFLAAVAAAVGEGVNRDNVELETIAERLEESIAADAVAGEVEQVRLAEIWVEGNTFVDEDDEGTIRASHILYAATDPESGQPLPEDDAAWEGVQADAELAAEQLRAIEDPDLRAVAFASRARRDSVGPSAPTGGDLGYFERFGMVPEFADPLFDDPELAPGDIVGPVRSEFGWHVIQFTDRRAPIMDRVDAVSARLAEPDADFAAIAADLSDGAEGINGGETGWHIRDDLFEETLVALDAIEVGEVTEAVDGEDGYYFYRKLEEGSRAFDAAQAAEIADIAFFDWYQERRFEAEDAGRISVDRSFFAAPEPAP